MFGFIIFVIVLSSVAKLFTRPFYGYYRPWYDPFGGPGLWGMGRYHGPMYRGGHHHMHHGGPCHHRHMGCGRRW